MVGTATAGRVILTTVNSPSSLLSKPRSEKTRVAGRVYERGKLDWIRCQYGLEGLVAGSAGRTAVPLPNEGEGKWQAYQQAKTERHPVDRILVNTAPGLVWGNFCEKCLHRCPAHALANARGK